MSNQPRDAIGATKNEVARATPLRFQREKYREHLNEMDLNTAQQDELLDAVWLICIGILDIAFMPDGDSKFAAPVNPLAADSADVLRSSITSEINRKEQHRG